jgi:hypothetical protein
VAPAAGHGRGHGSLITVVATGSAQFKPTHRANARNRGAWSRFPGEYRAGYMVPKKRRGSWASKSLARGVGLTSVAVLFTLLVLPATSAVEPVSAEEMPVSAVEEVCHTCLALHWFLPS